MNRLLLLFTLIIPCGSIAAADPPAKVRPNVILFLVDDMGWMDSTPYGSKYYETPNMERLARRAMRFTDAYAMPLCSPTRASILTGKYSARHGITSATGHLPPQAAGASLLPDSGPPNRAWIYPESRNYLDPSEFTLAEALHAAGYRTGHFGKWHLGLTETYWPDKQGFDFALHGKPDPGPGSYFSPYSFRRFQSFPDGPAGEYITDRLTDEALKFIADNQDRPFFLNLWHYGVHGPWGHKEEYTKLFAAKTDPRGVQGNPIMASMLRSIDESLGRVLDQLQKLRLTERTIVIFMSDNGGNIHSNIPEDRKRANVVPGHPQYAMLENWRKWAGDRPPTNNTPLRDGKGRLYEGGIRVPLMVQFPPVVPEGVTSGEVVGAIDLYPTLLDLLQLPPPVVQKMDGVSFASVLRGTGKLNRKAYFTWFPHLVPGVAVRQGDWKLIRRYEPTPEYPDGRELFNLRDDLGETKNLAATESDKVKQLDALIDDFLRNTGALVPKRNPDFQAETTKTHPAKTDVTKKSTENRLAGWVLRGCTAEIDSGALVVTGDGMAKSAFLARAGLKLAGPVSVSIRTRGTGGPARIQWRTGEQDQFPANGQVAAFTLPESAEWQVTRLELPVQGQLVHLRLYLPSQSKSVSIDSLQLRPANGEPAQWDFEK